MAQRYGFELETYGLTPEEISKAVTSVNGLVYAGHYSYHGSRHLGLRSKENGLGNVWVSERDSSICPEDTGGEYGSDHEVISPIVEGREGIESVCRVIKSLKRAGAETNENCSIHITFGMENSSARWNRMSSKKKAQVIVKLSEMFYFFQDGIMTLLPSRRNPSESIHAQEYCDMTRVDRDVSKLGTQHPSATSAIYDMLNYERGQINVQNLFSKGIIEFRSLEMTFDTHRVRTWALLLHKMLSYCVTSVSNGKYRAFQMSVNPSLEGLLWEINAGTDLIKDTMRMQAKNLLDESGFNSYYVEAV